MADALSLPTAYASVADAAHGSVADAALASVADAALDAPAATELGAPAGTFDGTVAADLAVAVSPSTGRFRPADLPSEPLPAGALLGHVTGGGGRADEVRVPVTAFLRDVLVRPGQLVARGQPLAWLHRAAASSPVDLELGWERA